MEHGIADRRAASGHCALASLLTPRTTHTRHTSAALTHTQHMHDAYECTVCHMQRLACIDTLPPARESGSERRDERNFTHPLPPACRMLCGVSRLTVCTRPSLSLSLHLSPPLRLPLLLSPVRVAMGSSASSESSAVSRFTQQFINDTITHNKQYEVKHDTHHTHTRRETREDAHSVLEQRYKQVVMSRRPCPLLMNRVGLHVVTLCRMKYSSSFSIMYRPLPSLHHSHRRYTLKLD